ncbi:MAG: ABC transporter ATP-binding protein [Promethearchaeota archaeon]
MLHVTGSWFTLTLNIYASLSATAGVMMDPIIRVEALTKQFGHVAAVKAVTFSVQAGEVLGVLGPNGAGKTTMVHLLTGLLRPTQGTAHIAGIDLSQIRLVKQQIGLMPEISNLYEELSVWRNLVFVAQLYGVPRGERGHRIRAILHQVDLEDRRDMLFRRLSKGLQRRVVLAAALIHQPSILILDEPTVGLDVLSRRLLHQMIRSLHEAGTTILLMTHFIEEAETLCNRVLILNRGQQVALATPAELCQQTGASNLEDAFVTITGLPIESMLQEKG